MIVNMDCIDMMRALLPDNSVDAIVTDPPYGLSFMGRKWDYDVPSVEIWAECLRVLKPGGHLLAFAGTRTQHRMAVRIEDAGFEIRDMIAWVYGSGFPKSLDVSKAIDKVAGEYVPGEVLPSSRSSGESSTGIATSFRVKTAANPQTDAARQWAGWGTALKPALEPITVARKPLIGTVAENVLAHGTGALNIDGCRVPTDDKLGGGNNSATVDRSQRHEGWQRPWMQDAGAAAAYAERSRASTARSEEIGRWPANLIHDGSDDVLAGFPTNAGASAPVRGTEASAASAGKVTGKRARVQGAFHADSGSAARFFYCAKASKTDRGAGNNHPTVKPTDLMRYLCRLVTPPGGTVFDPFAGSGSTCVAAIREGFTFMAAERDAAYFQIAQDRIERAYRSADER